ncbi:hypothetical protein KEM55_004006, partial [Ascosphaera atra]
MDETFLVLDAGKVHKLRLINSGAMGTIKFSIDGRRLMVTALDMVPIRPYTADHVVLSVGQRVELLVKAANNTADAYYMRAYQVGLPCGFSLQPFAKALIVHEDASANSKPRSHPHSMKGEEDRTCITQPLTGIEPLESSRVPEPDLTLRFKVSVWVNETGHQIYEVNKRAFHADYNHPLLLQAHSGNLHFESESNVYNLGANKNVRVVVESDDKSPH